MTQVKLVKLKIKPGKKRKWLNWCEELKKRKKEVILTLKNEKAFSESCFISNDGKYVYYFMEVENFEKARKSNSNSKYKIDKEHKEIRESSLKKTEVFDCLFNFNNRK